MLRCPVCQSSLTYDQKGYVCPLGHRFDQHRSSYTSLLHRPRKQGSGDDRVMMQARRQFLETGHYAFMRHAIIETLSTLTMHALVDLGCGEGYYTNAIQTAFPNTQVWGFDLSSEALKMASKNARAQYFVSSIAELPIKNHSIDVAINIFSPMFWDECVRILTHQGHLLWVNPSPHHLVELKSLIYPKVKLNPLVSIDDRFDVLTRTHIIEQHEVNPEDLSNLFHMTPYLYKSPLGSLEKITQGSPLKLTFEFDIVLLKIKSV